MKRLQLIAILTFLTPLIHIKDGGFLHSSKPLMENTKEEAQGFGWEMAGILRKGIEKGDSEKGTLHFFPQDFLSEEDKEKTFDSHFSTNDRDLKILLETSSKREKLEGTEEFFLVSMETIENPQRELGIASEKMSNQVSGERFETCIEGGNYEVFITQNLHVDATPAREEKISHCKGHRKEKSFFWKTDAENYARSKEKKLSKDQSLLSFNVAVSKGGIFKDYGVSVNWQHKDRVFCQRSWIETRIVQEASEIECWRAEDPEILSALEGNPNCRILYSQILAGPETRSINGVPVFRECWQRRLFFACGNDSNSKCAQLRELGSSIYKKKCIKISPFSEGECDLWEKTYRVSQDKVHLEAKIEFTGDDIWGIGDHFDSSYSANGDFAPAVTTLAIFSDIKEEAEKSHLDFKGDDAAVFIGSIRECQRSFVENVLYDCCSKMKGLAVDAKFCRCTSEEKDLAVKRDEGKCHFVGTYKKNLGTEKVQAFCCFPTKLARVIQEEGRKQLGLKWGSAEKPDCSGLSIDQLRSIDFSIIDFSELLDDLHVDKEWLKDKVESVAHELIGNEKNSDWTHKTGEILRLTEEKGGQNG